MSAEGNVMTARVKIAGLFLLGALGCGNPPSNNAPKPAPSDSVAPPQTAGTATAEPPASAQEQACSGRLRIGNVSFAPDGQTLTTACAGSADCNDASGAGTKVDVWSAAQGEIQRTVDAGMSNVKTMLWGAGDRFATVADPTTAMCAVRLFSSATWEKKFEVEHYCVSDIAFHPKGSSLVIAGCDGHMTAVNTATGKKVNRPEKEAHPGGDYYVGVEFSEDGKALFVDDESEGYQELDPVTLKRRATLRPPGAVCSATSPKGDLYAAAREDDSLIVSEVKSPAKPRTLAKEGGRECTSLAWLDASHIVVAFLGGSIAIWDVTGNGSRRDLTSPAAPGSNVATITSLWVGPAGRTFVSGDNAGALAQWDVATGARRELFRPPPNPPNDAPPPPALSPSPTGDKVAAFLGDRVKV